MADSSRSVNSGFSRCVMMRGVLVTTAGIAVGGPVLAGLGRATRTSSGVGDSAAAAATTVTIIAAATVSSLDQPGVEPENSE